MKVFVLTFVLFACMYVCSDAQDKKNELRIGLPGAYFFDDKQFRWYRTEGFLFIPSISYRRHISPHHAVSIGYISYFLPYGILDRPHYTNEILVRNFDLIVIS